MDRVEDFAAMYALYQGPRGTSGDVAEQLDVPHHNVLELQGGYRRAGGSDLQAAMLR